MSSKKYRLGWKPSATRKEEPLGVIAKGAYADLILIDGDPTKDIRLLMNSDNIHLIMKDGKIYKNKL